MTESKPDFAIKPISELVADPDFPESAVGKGVDIKGYTGVIVEVVRNSIKVRSSEGNTVSYNFHTLRRLYGPRLEPKEAPAAPAPPSAPVSEPEPKPEPKEEVVVEPNFNSPLVAIESLVHRPDFPACALGVFIDFHGSSGVGVGLVGHSLKVRSREGVTRSYNAEGLKRIYTNLPRSGSTVRV
jgi:hypothetical protein